jgi:glycosyltransferase involved in cell wall biosynthesis
MALNVGIYNLRINAGGGGEKKALVLAEHLSRSHRVWLITDEEPRRAALESYFGVDLSRVRVFVPRRPIVNGLHRLAPMLFETMGRLAEPALYPQLAALGLDAFLNCQWASVLRCPAPRGFYMCMFPHPLKGAHGASAGRSPAGRARLRVSNLLLGISREVLDSYTAVTANSAFTSDWIRKMWDVSAPVVYSACERMGPAAVKEKIIVNVGRFAGRGRADDKHQSTLLATFRKLGSLHEEGWQLHFAGTVLPGAEAKKQADELVESARGYPVAFHFNAAFSELRDLYRRAAIYWHATGYGSSCDTSPEKQEHFGVTTVEAMSAGAVPVVINTGGQRESVTHGADGFLWEDLNGLADHTLRVAGDVELCRQLSRNAVESSARFSREAFGERIERLILG